MKKIILMGLVGLVALGSYGKDVGDLTLTDDVVLESDLVVNVKAYGALGNGITDDTAAIQATIDFAVSNQVNELFFPAGNYIISDELAVHFTVANNGLILRGAGPGRTVLVQTAATNALTVYGSGLTESITIKDMKFTGQIEIDDPATFADSGDGISVYGDVDKSFKVVVLDNVMVEKFSTSLKLMNVTAATAINYSCSRNRIGTYISSLVGEATASYPSTFVGGMFHGNLVDVIGEDVRGLLFRGVDMCTQVCTTSMVFRARASVVSIEGCLFEPPATCTHIIVSEIAGNQISINNNFVLGEIGTDQYLYASLSNTGAGIRDYCYVTGNILRNLDDGGVAYLEGYNPQITGNVAGRKDISVLAYIKRVSATTTFEHALTPIRTFRNTEATKLEAHNRYLAYWDYALGPTTLQDDRYWAVYKKSGSGDIYKSELLNNHLSALLDYETTPRANTTTGAWETMHTTTIPARYIHADNAQVRFCVTGTFADNANEKGLQIFTHNLPYSSTTSTNNSGDFVFQGTFTVTDIDGNLARSQATLISDGYSQASVATDIAFSATISQAFLFRAWGGAAGDVIIKDIRVNYFNPISGE